MKNEAREYCEYVTAGFFNAIHINEMKMQIPIGSSFRDLRMDKERLMN